LINAKAAGFSALCSQVQNYFQVMLYKEGFVKYFNSAAGRNEHAVGELTSRKEKKKHYG
jgi:hypothetical protein